MKIWVDADACPGAVREIIIRAVRRLQVPAVFVANKTVALPAIAQLSFVRVAMGLDVADRHIAEAASKGDLAVTADIPLAAALVAKAVTVIDPRGTVFSEENIGEAVAVRDLMHDLRESGVETSGPKSFGPRDVQRFASAFDRALNAALQKDRLGALS
jgi:uncharacterized protein YaiI (UPF0178 family)